MTVWPKWLTEDYFGRYVGGQLETRNRYQGYCYRGEIASITLDDESLLTVTYSWLAIGVDENNRRSLNHPGGWVESSNTQDVIGLVVPPIAEIPGSPENALYVVRPVADGRLILDGGELAEVVMVFFPPGLMALQRDEVRPADPARPIDESESYVKGHAPGAIPLVDGSALVFYRIDSDGDPQRIELEDE
jgi:hypothetical protein